MKLHLRFAGLFLVCMLLATAARGVHADNCLELPGFPNDEADGYVRQTWGNPFGVGIAPELSYFTVDIQAAGGSFNSPTPPVPPGRYATWCFDLETSIAPGGPGYPTPGTMYAARLYSSCDPQLNSLLPNHPNIIQPQSTWNKVNWLINNRLAACGGVVPTMWEVQHAIYILFGEPHTKPGYPSVRASVVQCLVDAASAHGDFVPSCGQKTAVIFNIEYNWMDDVPDVQLLFIEVPVACIGDRVWNDSIGNDGVQDLGEVGVPGIKVDLYTCADVSMGSTVTDANGLYQFYVPGGNYYVKFSNLPANYVFSPSTASTASDATDSDANPSTGKTDCTNLAAGESDQTWDAGVYYVPPPPVPASLGNFVWNDANGNGVQDLGESGVPGVTVNLYDCSDVLKGTTSTDANGFYLFPGLNPSLYYVKFIAPNGYVFTVPDQGGDDATDSDANPATGRTICTTLDEDEDDMSWDAGIYQPAVIGDFVWHDLNANGVQQGEPGIAGVVVNLAGTTGSGSPVSLSDITDGSGAYLFDNLPPGTYTVTVDGANFVGAGALAGFAASPIGNGTPATDSNASPSGTTPATLAGGGSDLTIDFGYYKTICLGDLVWDDSNGNGIQDLGESGIPGVTVEIRRCSDGGLVSSTTTDGDGKYGFCGLLPGGYYLVFGKPAGYEFTARDIVGPNADCGDSDANASGETTCITLVSGQPDDYCWDTGLFKKVRVGDFVWHDLDADGVQDLGEPGIPGVTLTLTGMTGLGAPVTFSTTTDALGAYLFAGLEPGTYTVTVDASNFASGGALAGFVPSPTGIGGAGTDSNANPSGTTPAALPGGTSDLTIDFGYYKTICLGDLVWEDTNGNGIQDGGEAGISGAGVELRLCSNNSLVASTATDGDGKYGFCGLLPGSYYLVFGKPAGYEYTTQNAGSPNDDCNDSDAGADGKTACVTLVSGQSDDLCWDTGLFKPASIGDFVWEDTNANGIQDGGELGIAGVTVELYDCAGNLVATTTTGANGAYSFSNLAPGNYNVKVTAPGGYVITSKDQGGNDATDSDADVSGAMVCTTLDSGENDTTWDAGLYRKASLGDFVWSDTNNNGVQDPGESGIGGVLVKLYICGQTSPIATTTTAADGSYLFTDLAPGSYSVEFVQPASGYSGFSPKDQGGDDAKDSDADSTGKTVCYLLASGETNLTVDAGLKPVPCEPGLKLVKTTSTPMVQVGGTATYKYAVTNTGCTTLTDVQIVDDYGTPEYDGDDIVVGVVPSLAPGAGTTVTVSLVLPIDLCGPEANGSTEAGLLIAQMQANGDVEVVFIQDFGRNDNTYGLNSIGWKVNRPHRFKDLINSDQVTFSVKNAAGVEILKFKQDYTTAAPVGPDAPSGYKSLGVSGGDGAMLVGSAANLTAFSSSLAENLNKEPFLSNLAEYTVNSPALSDPNSGQWEYRMIYKFTIKKSAFGTGSFGSVAVIDQHNSPPKAGPDSFQPTPCGTCILNTAHASANSGTVVVQSNLSSATVCTTDGNPQPLLAELGDRVWVDTNKNGVQDSGELGLSSVVVKLYTCTGTYLKQTATGPAGDYFFSDLPAGSYKVQFILPSGYGFTPKDKGGNDATDSDADSNGWSPCVTLVAGSQHLTVDAGIFSKTTTPPPAGVGTGTPGYWMNHPEAWPVTSIVIGDRTYTRDQAIALMKSPVKSDKTYNMFAQLVSAKLNVMIGNPSTCISDTISAADLWMKSYPIGSDVKASSTAWKASAEALHETLDDYNNGELCAPHRG